MNADTLLRIKTECEKIETDPGFGKVLISIENFEVKIIQPTPTILMRPFNARLDKTQKK